MTIPKEILKVSDMIWELPVSYKPDMHVPARLYASEKLLDQMDDGVFDQITNVATLPGLAGYVCCMPDGHWGYGFPIGGVAAMDLDEGVISPGGIGFDINCGMRLINTNLTAEEIKPYIHKLTDRLFERIPAGVGTKGFVRISPTEFRRAIAIGAQWCIEKGFGWPEDIDRTEEWGGIEADASKVSEKAVERGLHQIGTLGSGNHYLEIQVAKPDHIHDKDIAKNFGIIRPDQIVIMFHCGSRGFGHQVATDYLQTFLKVMTGKYGLKVIDRELASAPFRSKEGQDYFEAMNCAINMSFINRQVIAHRIREVFSEVLGKSPESLGMHQIYDVSHNTAKIEEHKLEGRLRSLLVHRKGATRAFPPGNQDLPEVYQKTGQPVIIGGSMETGSYLLAGVQSGSNSFYSTAHGSGRTMSRAKARKENYGKTLQADMKNRGIYVRTASYSGLAEEAGSAYKDIDEVVLTTELAGISKRVVRFSPLGNVKG